LIGFAVTKERAQELRGREKASRNRRGFFFKRNWGEKQAQVRKKGFEQRGGGRVGNFCKKKKKIDMPGGDPDKVQTIREKLGTGKKKTDL